MAKGSSSRKTDNSLAKQNPVADSRNTKLPHIAGAVIVALGAALAWHWIPPAALGNASGYPRDDLLFSESETPPSADGHTAQLELLASLRTGNCSRTEIPTLDLRLLPASEARPLAGLRCPAVLVGAFQRCGISDVGRRWVNWRHIIDTTRDEKHTLIFDAQNNSPTFTYWDNNSALAQAVRERGVASQGYRKERARPAVFLERAQANSKHSSWIRYGSSLRSFSPALTSELGLKNSGFGKLAPLFASSVPGTDVNFWASSAGVTSTSHYDPAWDNLQLVVAGAKHAAIAPLSLKTYRSLEIRPSTHPHARQARRSLFQNNTGKSQAAEHILITTLAPGAGIFIPAGWLHELRAADDAPTAALSVVGVGHEKGDLEGLLGNPEDMLTPFFEAPYLAEDYTEERFATVLAAFVPKFTHLLQLDGDELGGALLASYGHTTCHEAGMPSPNQASASSSRCQKPAKILGKQDLKAVKAAAKKFAARFRKYRRELLPHYVLLFFDALLSKVGGSGSAAEVVGRMVAWLSDCRGVLFPAGRDSSST